MPKEQSNPYRQAPPHTITCFNSKAFKVLAKFQPVSASVIHAVGTGANAAGAGAPGALVVC